MWHCVLLKDELTVTGPSGVPDKHTCTHVDLSTVVGLRESRSVIIQKKPPSCMTAVCICVPLL